VILGQTLVSIGHPAGVNPGLDQRLAQCSARLCVRTSSSSAVLSGKGIAASIKSNTVSGVESIRLMRDSVLGALMREVFSLCFPQRYPTALGKQF